MCGIAGFVGPQRDREEASTLLASMGKTLSHRGPDSDGTWYDQESGAGLAHQRLSIIDLSDTGSQPMISAGGRYIISYNGEVYNYKELREELAHRHPAWNGSSDTEVVLAAIEEWGLEAAIKKFIGMFAFALWDKHTRKMHLIRDRMGIKPMYYGLSNGSFIFGSELKALRRHPSFQAALNRNSLALFFMYGYIPAPHTIYENFFKLEPGYILEFDQKKRKIAKSRFWNIEDSWNTQGSNSFSIEDIHQRLKDAVQTRMIADVPLGVFLSGGIDSSLVTAVMQSLSSATVKSFTIGFENEEFDEANEALNIAKHLGTDHTEFYISHKEIIDIIPSIPQRMDEPFGDSSLIPTLLVSKLARDSVTVCLSGDGGDEIFGGYNVYKTAMKWNKWLATPRLLRCMAARLGETACKSVLSLGAGISFEKASWRAALMSTDNIQDIYNYLISHYNKPEALVPGASILSNNTMSRIFDMEIDPLRKMQLYDLLTYLPEDILTKVDRASMSVSLETRVPIIDHLVVEAAANISSQANMRHGEGKQILRTILKKYIPEAMTNRPKKGFSIPLNEWLKTDLKTWAQDRLNESTIRKQNLLNPKIVGDIWKEFLHGQDHWASCVWNILVFQAWMDTYKVE